MTDREMLARLLRCEAGGEGEDGMKAVATNVMNRVRVKYGEYYRVNKGNLQKVILQPRQYTCAYLKLYGKPNKQNLWATSPEAIHYKVADWAIANNIFWPVGSKALWYQNPFNPVCPKVFPSNGVGYNYSRIRQHCYYNPTAKYAQT